MNLFIGNLSPETSEEQLRNAFTEFGVVNSVKIIIDPQTSMPKGFGFVEMEERRDGYEAITHLDMTYLQGTIISVKEAKNSRQQSGGGGNRQGSGGRPFQRRQGSGGGYNSNRQSGYGDRQGGTYGERKNNFNSDRPAYSKRPNYNSNNFNSNNNDRNNSLDY